MEEPEPRPPALRKLSKTPSWVLLGFAAGVLFMWLLPVREAPSAESAPQPPVQPPVKIEPPPVRSMDEIEAVFAMWGTHAVWAHELTEVSLWDAATGDFSRHYEVLRNGDELYFRSITGLTRPLLTYGVPDDAPLRFTEPESRRDEWLRARRQEILRAITDSIPKADRR